MPLSSIEAAQQIGAFAQQTMGNMQYAGMIGMGARGFGMMPFGMQSDSMMGGVANRAYSMGAPMMQGAMGLMGLDPFSLGMRAAGGVWGAGGGVLGAGMAGIGAMGLGAGAMAGAGWAGNQMYTGMQQQQHLNQMLRSNFQFMGAGGHQGFDRSQMASIGGAMRGMTHQFGPGGEVTGFSELTSLAANMGKMGMGQGIRDAQEFSRKFKEMLTTLKGVATELGTTLSGAQEFLASQKSSGIFRTADQLRFSSQARNTALAGNMALSEVTSMANIGSQISRSVGGLGTSGAFGGMRAIGQVGSAVQTGALSEEDIYNTTGLTGAEGRQALAASQMQQTARFLKTSKGRYFLASVAGANGRLDEGSVANWMAGGMSVGDTKSQAHANLGRIGRANFIRNEGRLRGSVMERFGGLAPALALSQWASGKGIDINEMDDRSMLFAQRQLGMGRDEMDTAVKMAQNLPEILRQQRLTGQDDEYMQRSAQQRRGQGIEGLKRRLDQVREGIQGKLQQVGSDLFTSGTDMIEQWWNRLTGTYEKRVSGDIDQLMQSARMGGRGGAALSTAVGGTGLVGAGMSMFQGATDAARGRIGGGPVSGGAGAAAYNQSRDMRFAAQAGAAAASTGPASEFAEKSKDWIREAYTTRLAALNSERRVGAFGNTLKARADSGDAQAQAMYAKWSSASPAEQAGMLGAIEKQTGIGEKAGLGATWQMPGMGTGSFGFATQREADVALGKTMIGDRAARTGTIDSESGGGWLGAIGRGVGRALDAVVVKKEKNTVGDFLTFREGGGMNLKDRLGGVVSGGTGLAAATGAYLRSEEGSGMLRGLMTGEKGAFAKAENRLQELSAQMGEKDGRLDYSKLGRGEQAEFSALAVVSLGAEYAKLSKEGAPTAKVRALEEKASRLMGRPVSEKDLRGFYGAGAAAMGEQAQRDLLHVVERTTERLSSSREALQTSGLAVMKDGQLQLANPDKLGPASRQALQMSIDAANMGTELSRTVDPEAQSGMINLIYGKEGAFFERVAGMSTAEKRQLAKEAAGTEAGSMAGESLMRERRMGSLIKSQARRGIRGGAGQVGAVASQLGLSFSKEQLQGLGGKTPEEVAKLMAGQLGAAEGSDFQKGLAEAMTALKGGKTGQAADLLARAAEQADAKTKERIKQGRGEGDDPVTAAIKSTGKEYVNALKTSTSQIVAAISGIDNDNPEGKADNPACLSGDTLVTTKDGRVPIRELAGKTVDVLVQGGTWQSGYFRSYGEHPLFKIELSDGQVFRATAEHRWPFDIDGDTYWTLTPQLEGKKIFYTSSTSELFVRSVTKLEDKEEVFCGNVPITHTFTIGYDVLTGNK